MWPRTAELADGRLVALGGCRVEELAATWGTPLWLLDEAELRGRVVEHGAAFGADVELVYAAKALCVTGVLQLLAGAGLSVDVASAGELATAERAGIDPARIVLHGNAKSDAELTRAIAVGVGRVAVDGFGELARLGALAAAAGRRVGVLLRVTPGVPGDTHDFVSTGQDDVKFGFKLRHGEAHAAVARALADPSLELRGLHCHVGSQLASTSAVERSAGRMVGLLADVRQRHGVALEELDLGGGFGVPYVAGDRAVPLPEIAGALRRAVAAACAERRMPQPRLVVEPGRSLVATAGVTLYRIVAVKPSPGPGVRTYVAVDGGMSDNLRPALYGARYTFAAAGSGARGAPDVPVAVAGKHCETGDLLGDDVALPADLAPGDLLAVAATGAYHHALASNYNRLPRPAMVLVGDGRARAVVRRETVEDVLARDVPL